MEHTEHEPSSAKTWIIIALLLIIVIFKGGLAYFLIGDRGQPDWDYRPVKDVPGESPFAVYEYFHFPQHVKGDETDYPPLTDDKSLAEGWNRSFFPSPKTNAMDK
jgi:hypothetical protein